MRNDSRRVEANRKPAVMISRARSLCVCMYVMWTELSQKVRTRAITRMVRAWARGWMCVHLGVGIQDSHIRLVGIVVLNVQLDVLVKQSITGIAT